MAIARITGTGLIAIALSVAGLWGCIAGERITARQATEERVRILRDLRRLRRTVDEPQPAATPVRVRHSPRPIAG
jgi:hypothetical protein